jgi:acyl-CoA reductase-like NAD-dependent aldehyde dehydrogenase
VTPQGANDGTGLAGAVHANWVGGAHARSAGAGLFTLRAALDPSTAVGRWPRSAADDVAGALPGLVAAARSWTEFSPGTRARRLTAAGRALAEDDEGAAVVCAALGTTAEELAPHMAACARSDVEPSRSGASGGWSLCAPDWTELFAGAFGRAARELALGRAVLLLSDERLPMISDRLLHALVAAGVPEGVVGVLHGPRVDAVARAVEGAELRAVTASGSVARIARLRQLCADASIAEQRLSVPRARSFEVTERDDLAAVARAVVEGAFGRGPVLGGQASGQIARAFCSERLLSRFTEALLAELARSDALERPLPLVDAEAVQRAQRAWARGLDEGATLIQGGRLRDAAQRIAEPTVFTNVELSMQAAARNEPSPVLSLLRVAEQRPGKA